MPRHKKMHPMMGMEHEAMHGRMAHKEGMGKEAKVPKGPSNKAMTEEPEAMENHPLIKALHRHHKTHVAAVKGELKKHMHKKAHKGAKKAAPKRHARHHKAKK